MSEYGYRSTLGLTALFTLTFPWFLNAFIMSNCLAYEKKRGRIDFDIYGINIKMYLSIHNPSFQSTPGTPTVQYKFFFGLMLLASVFDPRIIMLFAWSGNSEASDAEGRPSGYYLDWFPSAYTYGLVLLGVGMEVLAQGMYTCDEWPGLGRNLRVLCNHL